ncbi:MAG: tryptophan-rich sensory protein [Rhodospirillales bacterium]|nr:tryptophan-rich sensory protein [Rhodospirillales bacterium]
MRRWFLLVGFVALTMAASGLARIPVDAEAMAWYDELSIAPWNPGSWFFPAVWGILYTLLGIALWMIWTAGPGEPRNAALWVFALQFSLNVAWTWIFFGLQAPFPALLEIATLIGTIVWSIRMAWWVAPFASLVMLPYLAWVCIAATLNAWVAFAN